MNWKTLIDGLYIAGSTLGIFAFYLALLKAGAKPMPKPGKDFDERGPY